MEQQQQKKNEKKAMDLTYSGKLSIHTHCINTKIYY